MTAQRGNVSRYTEEILALDYLWSPPRGLFWINAKDSNGSGGTTILNVNDKYNINVRPYMGTALINVVDDKRSGYTHCSYLKAQLARKIQHKTERPSTKDHKRYVEKNDMIDCPISIAYMNVAGDIFGKD